MTIHGEVKKMIYSRYQKSCIETMPPDNVSVVSVDMMMYLKGTVPSNYTSLDSLIKWFCRKATNHLTANEEDKVHTVVINFDLGSPGVKKIVGHKKRYGKNGKIVPLKFEKGPHLNGKLPESWVAFSADTRNLRREIYPLIYNELLKYIPLMPYHRIIVNGLPIKSIDISNYDTQSGEGYMARDKVTRRALVKWEDRDFPIPLIEKNYHTTFELIGLPPNQLNPNGLVRISEKYNMQNDIHEADSSTFYFSKFFPHQNIMISMNDGDGIMIGLMKVAEDVIGPHKYKRQTYLQLPVSVGEVRKKELYGEEPWPRHDYINLTKLYSAIQSDKIFVEKGVQSPVASLVYMAILGGTDFVKKGFYRVGWKNGIWQTYIDNLDKYSHMVQCYYFNRINDPDKFRQVVTDENLFLDFGRDCHKKNIECTKDEIHKVLGRTATWNINYWANAPYNDYIDPFELYEGHPLWGYTPKSVAKRIRCSQKPVDEVFSRNFKSNKKRKFTV